MSLEMKIGDRISRCENCGRRTLSPMVMEGLPFCNSLCHTEWRWKKEGRKGL